MARLVARMQGNPIVGGSLLIGLGLGLYWLQRVDVDEAYVLLLVGSAFFGAAILWRNYGFLVPGALMLGLGFGRTDAPALLGVSEGTNFGLGLGFLLLYAVDATYLRQSNWWPLFPGIALLATAVARDFALFGWLLDGGWPLLLVALGVFLIARGMLGRGSADGD